MTKCGIVVQARMASTRLPGKVLMPLPIGSDRVVLDWVISACLETGFPVYVATSTNPEDDAIGNHVCIPTENWKSGRWHPKYEPELLFRGSPEDVLDRMYQCAKFHGLDEIVRITGDCPFIDPEVIKQVVALRRITGANYASNVDPPTWPDGLDVQVASFSALERAHVLATDPSDRECVMQYIVHHRRNFRVANLPCPIPNAALYRWVLDTEADYQLCSRMAAELIADGVTVPHLSDLLDVSQRIPQFDADLDLRNERYAASRAIELKADRFDGSSMVLKRALRAQPYGASTYSKSHVAWGDGAPLYVTHAQGSRIWDVDGNELIDMTAGLGTTILGHCDPHVRAAIEAQLDIGIAFPLAHELEHQVAEELIRQMHPGKLVEDYKVVFGKNGSDVTSAAVRVARVAAGRNEVVVEDISYHGWHDWTLTRTSRGGGTQALNVVRLNNEMIVKNYHPIIAGTIILEPDHFTHRELINIIKRAHSTGMIVIFDEMVTAFRYPKTTYAATYGLEPDMICLGKALGNGMPITALVGKREIMDHFVTYREGEPYAFYSGTHLGEMLSLAAARCVIERMGDYNQDRLVGLAGRINAVIGASLAEHGFIDRDDVTFECRTIPRLTFRNPIISSQFRREMAHNGVLVYGLFLPSLAHTDADLEHLRAALENSLNAIKSGMVRGGNAPSGIMRS